MGRAAVRLARQPIRPSEIIPCCVLKSLLHLDCIGVGEVTLGGRLQVK